MGSHHSFHKVPLQERSRDRSPKYLRQLPAVPAEPFESALNNILAILSGLVQV
jgi:hypothetical protein